MSLTENQTNKVEASLQSKGRPTRAQRKSVIADAIRYEAVQGAPPVDASDNALYSASHLESTQTSVFSAFGTDAAKSEVESFETGRPGNNTGADHGPASNMTKQCSMVHRMMEKGKTDVDPRDLQYLLPSTMLTSESLDLRQDGKIARGMSGMDLHKLLEDQAMKFNAERSKGAADQDSDSKGSSSNNNSNRLSPTAEELDPAEGGPSGNKAGPSSPVTGWPAAAVLGIMHPMHHTLQPVVKPNHGTSAAMGPSPLLYTESTSAMACLNGNPGGVLVDWRGAYGNQQIYPRPSYPANPSPTVIFEHPVQEEQYALNYTHPGVQTSSDEVSPCEENSPRASDSSSPKKKKDADAASKKFKSLEAALAWCHVQHSQKQVPVVPKDDVRKLVDFQLNSGKPIRAPWYRPQSDKPEVRQTQSGGRGMTVVQDASRSEKPVEKKPVCPAPRPRKMHHNVPKQGTGFFCPPGSALAHV